MSKIFDENKLSTFKNLKDLATGNKLVGRREIIIVIDETAIEELRNYVYKSEMYDEKVKEIKRLNNIIDKIKKSVEIAIDEDNYDGGIYDIESILGSDKE